MKKRVLACILAAALLTTGIPGGQAAMAQSLTENGTEMATEEVNPEKMCIRDRQSYLLSFFKKSTILGI